MGQRIISASDGGGGVIAPADDKATRAKAGINYTAALSRCQHQRIDSQLELCRNRQRAYDANASVSGPSTSAS